MRKLPSPWPWTAAMMRPTTAGVGVTVCAAIAGRRTTFEKDIDQLRTAYCGELKDDGVKHRTQPSKLHTFQYLHGFVKYFFEAIWNALLTLQAGFSPKFS